VEREETALVRLRPMNMSSWLVIMEELLEAMFPVPSVPRLYGESHQEKGFSCSGDRAAVMDSL
jgi:hypothetical protein